MDGQCCRVGFQLDRGWAADRWSVPGRVSPGQGAADHGQVTGRASATTASSGCSNGGSSTWRGGLNGMSPVGVVVALPGVGGGVYAGWWWFLVVFMPGGAGAGMSGPLGC